MITFEGTNYRIYKSVEVDSVLKIVESDRILTKQEISEKPFARQIIIGEEENVK